MHDIAYSLIEDPMTVLEGDGKEGGDMVMAGRLIQYGRHIKRFIRFRLHCETVFSSLMK